jgi:hypothetical protein
MAKSLPVAKIRAVLVYIDEPQLLLLTTEGESRFIAVATPEPNRESPFLAAEISEEQWQRYNKEFVDLRYLFQFPTYKRWYVFEAYDFSGSGIKLVPIKRNDGRILEYMPDHGFFSRSHTEEYELDESETSTQSYAIDGAWNAVDFSRFNGLLDDIYSFAVTIRDFSSDSVFYKLKSKIAKAFSNYPLKGGSSYVHFYDDLERAYPFAERLKLEQIQYASPGHIDFRGNAKVFEEIDSYLTLYAANRPQIREQQQYLIKYLKSAGLLKEAISQFNKKSDMAPQILGRVSTLALTFGFSRVDVVQELTDNNALATAKLILSFVRRLEKAYMFFAEGRATLKNGHLKAQEQSL